MEELTMVFFMRGLKTVLWYVFWFGWLVLIWNRWGTDITFGEGLAYVVGATVLIFSLYFFSEWVEGRWPRWSERRTQTQDGGE
jgi:hypothetical protein